MTLIILTFLAQVGVVGRHGNGQHRELGADQRQSKERARKALRKADDVRLTETSWCAKHERLGRHADDYYYGDDCIGASGDYPREGEPWCEAVYARDMRGQHVPELPEASAREGACFVADGLPGPDGRVKIVCQSGSREVTYHEKSIFSQCCRECHSARRAESHRAIRRQGDNALVWRRSLRREPVGAGEVHAGEVGAGEASARASRP